MPEPSQPIPNESSEIPITGRAQTPETPTGQPNLEFTALISYFQNQIEAYNNKQRELTTAYTDHENRLKKVEDKIDENRTKLVETLGVFIALFTFISIEFSLFQKITVISQVLSLTFILGGLLMLFVLILDLVVRSSIRNDGEAPEWFRYFGRLCMLSIILIIIGIIIAFVPVEFDKQINNDKADKINQLNIIDASPSASIIPNPSE